MTQTATRTGAPTGVPTGASRALASPSPGPVLLDAVRDLPGLTHARLVDASGDHVIAELGTDDDTAGPVLAWGRSTGGVATGRGSLLEDLIVTSDRAHHLLRSLDLPAVPGAWVYLRIRRDQGNLALSRRRLAAVGRTGTIPGPAPEPAASPGPATPPASTRTAPARAPWVTVASSPAVRAPAPAALAPAPAAPAPPSSLSAAPAAATAIPAGPPAAPSPATRSSSLPGRVPPTTSAPAPMPTRKPATTPARTPPAAITAATPAAAPVAVPTAPPAPELPAPRRPPGTSTRSTPSTGPSAPAAVTPTGPDGRDEAPHRPVRDNAGVLGQRWRTDPETLRRVLAGLLRLGRAPQAALAGAPDGPDTTTTPRSPGATPTRRNP